MKSGFETKGGNESSKEKPAFVPPSVEEMARLFPQLEIIELLGHGGMGAVYKARQPRLNRFVALKILSPEKQNDPQFAERFEREARTLAWLSHPNIVTVYDFGEVQGHFYLLMEFVDGLTLRQLFQVRKLSPAEALGIVPKICEALQFAHEQGVIHRDIKPENILLDKKGQVKIADFGIAKIMDLGPGDLSLTGAKDVVGTPHYMAPEQIEKPQSVDGRADIYSLGVVFYEMLTGELPLGKFQPPSQKVQIDVRLDEVVLHALEKEPDRRYQQASEVKTDVEAIAHTTALPANAPAANQAVPPGDYTLGIGRCLRRGWALVRGDFWPIVGVTLLVFILINAASATMAGIILVGPLLGGLWLYYLKKIRGEPVGVGTAFSGFSIAFLQLFLAALVPPILIFIGFLCLIVPGIYLAVAWMFTLALVTDKRLSFGTAMKLSRKTISRHWWKFLGLLIVLSLLNLIGSLVCFIGLLITIPITLAALAYAYEDIFCPAEQAMTQPPTEAQPSAVSPSSQPSRFPWLWATSVTVMVMAIVTLVLWLKIESKMSTPPGPTPVTSQQAARPASPATTSAPINEQVPDETKNEGPKPLAGGEPQRGLVALWSGENNGHDSAGTNNALLTDMAFTKGKVGSAFSLNGRSSYAKVPASPSLDMENCRGLTMAAWIRPTDVSGFHPIIEWYSATTLPLGIGCQLRLGWRARSQGMLVGVIVDMDGRYHVLRSPPDTVVANRFQYVAVTYDQSTGIGLLYVNGHIVAQARWRKFPPKTKGDLWISYRPFTRPSDFTYNTFFAGLLDEIAVYNRALSAGEIQAYYNSVTTDTHLSPNRSIPPVLATESLAKDATSPAKTSDARVSDLTIRSAIFGAENHIADVTERVIELLRSQPDGFAVNAQWLGIDPKPGRGKLLTILYDYKGHTFTLTIPAGNEVSYQSLVKNANETTTNNTPHSKTMSYTLTFEDSQKTIPNPNEADIRAALIQGTSDDFGPVFRIGLDGTDEMLQVVEEAKGRFSFGYYPNANEQFFSKRDNFSTDEAMKVLMAYQGGSPDWKKLVEWKH